MTAVEEVLDSQGIQYKISNSELITDCLECGKVNHFYINRFSGLGNCKVCGYSPNLYQIKEKLGIITKIKEPEKVDHGSNLGMDIQKAAVQYSYDLTSDPSKLEQISNQWGISKETLKKYYIGICNKFGKDWITIPTISEGQIWNIKYRTWFGLEKEFMREKGGTSMLYNVDEIPNMSNKYILLSEGERDSLTLIDRGIKNVIGNSGGANTFKPEWLPYLEKFEKIYICYEKGTGIYTKDKICEIENIEVGDLVWTHTGSLKPVTETLQSIYSGNMFSFKVAGQKHVTSPFVTANHPLFIYPKENRKKKHNKRVMGDNFIWAASRDIRVGDFFAFPIFKNEALTTPLISYKNRFEISKRDDKGRVLNTKGVADPYIINQMDFVKDPDFSYFLGVFLGDGSFSPKKHRMEIAYNTTTKMHIKTRIERYFNKHEIKYSIYESKDGKTHNIYTYDWRFTFLNELLYKNNVKKEIGLTFAFHTLINKTRLLQGLLDTDGTKTKKWKHLSFSNTNKNIIRLVELLSLYEGYTICTHKWNYKDKNTWNTRYTISITKPNRRGNGVFIKEHQGTTYLLYKVEEVEEKVVEKETVYNLEVDEDNSYITEQKVVSHNCYDFDPAGESGARKLVKRLGLDRCYEVKLPTKGSDISDYFVKEGHSRDDFKELLKASKPFNIPGVITLGDSYSMLYNRYKEGKDTPDVDTPWERVNTILNGGFFSGQLVTIAGQAKSLKTHISYIIAEHVARKGVPVFIYELEMNPAELAKRNVTRLMQVPYTFIDPLDILLTKIKQENVPIYIGEPSGSVDYKHMIETIKAVYQRFGVGFVVIDHAHLIIRSSDHLVEKIGMMVKDFAFLAKELEIPILLLAQPNKAKDPRHRDTYSNIGWSNAFATDSDVILIIHRNRSEQIDKNGTENMIIQSKIGEGDCFDPEASSFSPIATLYVDASRTAAGGLARLWVDPLYFTVEELDSYEGEVEEVSTIKKKAFTLDTEYAMEM